MCYKYKYIINAFLKWKVANTYLDNAAADVALHFF